jgi:hypothetical protein
MSYCEYCGGQHAITTAACGALYTTDDGFIVVVPRPDRVIMKTMPCGHLGMLVKDKWVCQICGGWERQLC